MLTFPWQCGGAEARPQARLGTSESADGAPEPATELLQVLGYAVGQRAIRLAPDVLRRIEFRGIGREEIRMDSRTVGQVHLDFPASMDRATVPDQHHRTAQVPQQGLAEGSDIQAIEGPCRHAEIECQALVSRGNHQRTDGGELVALEPMVEVRGLPFRGPGAFDGRGERKATLVDEDEMCPQAFSLFLYAARRSASSGRWPARCAGAPVVPASGSSSRVPAAAPRWSWDDRTPPSAAGSRRQPAGGSRGRCGSLPVGGPARAGVPGAVSGARS